MAAEQLRTRWSPLRVLGNELRVVLRVVLNDVLDDVLDDALGTCCREDRRRSGRQAARGTSSASSLTASIGSFDRRLRPANLRASRYDRPTFASSLASFRARIVGPRCFSAASRMVRWDYAASPTLISDGGKLESASWTSTVLIGVYYAHGIASLLRRAQRAGGQQAGHRKAAGHRRYIDYRRY